MIPARPTPPPQRCWTCGKPLRACRALQRAALALDLAADPNRAKCCPMCVHPPNARIPHGVPGIPNHGRRRGRQARAVFREWLEAR